MERQIGAERLYSLAQYQNIKFINNLTGIPESIANNPKAVELLFYQASLSCDIAYARYKKLIEQMAREGVTDVLEFLEAERETSLKELVKELQKQ